VYGSNVNATAEVDEITHVGYTPSYSVWYSWTAATTGPIQIDTIGSGFDTILEVYSGTAASYGALTAIDGAASGADNAVAFLATAGQKYFFVVDSQTATGQIQLNISVPPPPANDNLANAEVLVGSTASITGSTFAATAQTGEPAHNGHAASSSVWYSWTAAENGTITVNAFGHSTNPAVSVYNSTVASFAGLVSVAEGANAATFTAVAGTTYYLAVDTVTTQSEFNLILGNNSGVQVAVFANTTYVDATSTSSSSEAYNVQYTLVTLGYTVNPFTGLTAASINTALIGASVLEIPEQERGSIITGLDAAATSAIAQFVNGGGGLIIHGFSERADDFLNGVFGFAISDEVSTSSSAEYPLQAAAEGTPFAGCSPTIPWNNGTSALRTATLPGGSTVIYQGGTGLATVAVIPYGAGRIVYCGWDFYDAWPNGTLDSGWIQVYNAAVLEASGI
jgi:hypothetical protein